MEDLDEILDEFGLYPGGDPGNDSTSYRPDLISKLLAWSKSREQIDSVLDRVEGIVKEQRTWTIPGAQHPTGIDSLAVDRVKVLAALKREEES